MGRFTPLIQELEHADRLLKEHSEEIKRIKLELEHKQQAENKIKEIQAAILNHTYIPDNKLVEEIKRILGTPRP